MGATVFVQPLDLVKNRMQMSGKQFHIKFYLRLQYTFRSAIFFKFRFFSLSNDPNEISNKCKKEIIEKN